MDDEPIVDLDDLDDLPEQTPDLLEKGSLKPQPSLTARKRLEEVLEQRRLKKELSEYDEI
jgi:hypothetical protein